MHTDILIIGGGIAGLSAAICAAELGLKVILLEAKNRLGGRIYTQNLNNGTHVEIGASFWEGVSSNPFYQEHFSHDGSENKPGTIQLDFSNVDIVGLDGKSVGQHKTKRLFQIGLDALQNAFEKDKNNNFNNYEDLINNLDFRLLPEDDVKLLKKGLRAILIEMNTPANVVNCKTIQDEYADPLNRYNIDDAFTTFITGGLDNLIQRLADKACKLGVRIHLDTPVQRIMQNKDSVMVTTPSIRYFAKSCICTVPAAVLKKNPQLIYPPLYCYADKYKALCTLGIHPACRVILKFKQAFWTNTGPYIFLDDPDEAQLVEFRNGMGICNQPFLSTDAYARLANDIYKKTPNEVIAKKALVTEILRDLQQAFAHTKIPEPEEIIVHNWSFDPYAQGAYPYPSKATKIEHIDALQAPINKVHFAGEYTSKHGYSIHNAYAEGIRVAKEVCHQLKPVAKKLGLGCET